MTRLAFALMVLMAGSAQAAETACRVTVDVTDTDPHGLNVRAAPGGKVIATLVDKADWIELHVVARTATGTPSTAPTSSTTTAWARIS